MIAPPPNYLPVRQDRLDRPREPALEPELPIVDPHHHLWDRPGWRYLLDERLFHLVKLEPIAIVDGRQQVRQGVGGVPFSEYDVDIVEAVLPQQPIGRPIAGGRRGRAFGGRRKLLGRREIAVPCFNLIAIPRPRMND